MPQKQDILGYFDLNSKNVNEKDKKTIGFNYVFSDQSICIKVKICLGLLEEKSIPMIPIVPIHGKKFERLQVLCQQNNIIWALNYEKIQDSEECRLELTKNRKKLGQFLGEGSSKSKSKNTASLLAFEGWNEMIETFELPRISSIPENESLQISAIQQSDLFTRLQELSQQYNVEWALNYEKQGDNVECQLTLTTNDGRKRLELGNFNARGHSKSVAKNNAVFYIKKSNI